MLSKALEFVKGMTVDTFIAGVKVVGHGLLIILQSLVNGGEPVFIVIAMVGVFISMAGNRSLGTKVSSLSILSYILLKAVL